MTRLLSIILCLFLVVISSATGHSGRTDSNGGHWDRKYGTGYHYHHGTSAHQHPNGKCPYLQTTDNNGYQYSSNNQNGLTQYGLTKDEVFALQRKLTTLGYYTLGIDGVYGSGTIKAVKKFQTAYGLYPDGICGPKTRAALGI